MAAIEDEPNSSSGFSQLSADGRYVAFYSEASNIVENDINQEADIFIYDRIEQKVERVSVGYNGIESNSGSDFFAMATDGQSVAFVTDATNLDPNDINFADDLFVYDRQSKVTSSATIRAEVTSIVYATQTTIALTQASEVSVNGRVHLDDSLLAGNRSFFQSSSAVTYSPSVIDSRSAGSDRIGPLTRFGYLPPVHPLLLGNPAINAGDSVYEGTTDQLGKVREVPDVGSFETTFAVAKGKVFVDLNQNGRLDEGEPGLADVSVSDRNQTGDLVVNTRISANDDPQSKSMDESGEIEFINLQVGDHHFEISVPEKFLFSQGPIERIQGDKGESNQRTAQHAISGDGRFVAFTSNADNLVPGDTNSLSDVFLYDRVTRSIRLVSNAMEDSWQMGIADKLQLVPMEDSLYSSPTRTILYRTIRMDIWMCLCSIE